ncbi:Axin-1 [Labeo rohita]|uniref:Axin-1 n=1 Tax=Labeo rohita TaxID=84645 RepID=A0ABQ8MW31_LABRO|nr:Axin-1 [Labeo rohita]
MPKDIHVEPEKFAAELISRLEGVLREREAQEKLEERLKRVRLEEEGDDADISTAPSLANHRIPPAVHVQHYGGRYSEMSYNGLQLRDAHEENPESILDEHVQRVMKTPGCQSPGTGRHSPKSRSPDGLPAGKISGMMMPLSGGQGKHQTRLGPKGEASHLHHHKHIHHTHYAAAGKPKEQRPIRKGDDGRNFEMREPLPGDDMERNQKILQSISGSKKAQSHEVSRPSSVERPGAVHPWVTAQLRNNVQPSHPFIQDPTMPPNPAPNPLTQLEEARRRLEEERRKSGTLQAKQRYVMEVIQRGRTAVRPALFPTLSVVPAVSDTELSEAEYYFKKVSDEFDCGVVFEEVREDDAILPIFEEKIIGKVEKID